MSAIKLSKTASNELALPGTAVTVSSIIGSTANGIAQRIGVWGMCFLGFAGGWTAHKAWPTAANLTPISATQPAQPAAAATPGK